MVLREREKNNELAFVTMKATFQAVWILKGSSRGADRTLHLGPAPPICETGLSLPRKPIAHRAVDLR